MVVARWLVPVEHGQLDLERALVCAHVEEELLVPGGVQGVSDYARPEDILPKEMTTKGSMSHPVRVTKYVRKQNRLSVKSVGMYKGLGRWETHCF